MLDEMQQARGGGCVHIGVERRLVVECLHNENVAADAPNRPVERFGNFGCNTTMYSRTYSVSSSKFSSQKAGVKKDAVAGVCLKGSLLILTRQLHLPYIW